MIFWICVIKKYVCRRNWHRPFSFTQKKATALFVDSVDFANSLINYFSERGLELRKDYSVVAVERGVTAETKDALITAVSLPDFDYGRQCGQLMMEVI